MEIDNANGITAEESIQIEKEYEINHVIIALDKAKGMLGGNVTIEDALNELYKRTRFANEIKRYIGEQKNFSSLHEWKG